MTRSLPRVQPAAPTMPTASLSTNAAILLSGSWYRTRRGGILRLRRQAVRR
jgi:hypothetical protein